MTTTAIHVTYSVSCRRRIVGRCLRGADRTDLAGISAAEAAFRAAGWKLHTDGTASCPVCLKAWEMGSPREGLPAPDPDAAFTEAAEQTLATEVEGDGGLGEALRGSDPR